MQADTLESLRRKLSPGRFPEMDAAFAAIVGYVLNRPAVVPSVIGINVVDDGETVVLHSDDGTSNRVGSYVKLQAQWHAFLDAVEAADEDSLSASERMHACRLFEAAIEVLH